MCKSEVFNDFLAAVSRETEIPAEEILGRTRTLDVVDARCLLFYFLRKKGLSTATIAAKAGRTSASVRYLVALLDRRAAESKMVHLYKCRLEKQLENDVK